MPKGGNDHTQSFVDQNSVSILRWRRFLINRVSPVAYPLWCPVLVLIALIGTVLVLFYNRTVNIDVATVIVAVLTILGVIVYRIRYFRSRFDSDSHRDIVNYGESITRHLGPYRGRFFGSQLLSALKILGNPQAENWEPFLRVRGIDVTHPLLFLKKPPELGGDDWGSIHQMALFNVAYLFKELGCYVHYKENDISYEEKEGEPIRSEGRDDFRDYITRADQQKNVFDDGGDMALRFRQWSPELSVDVNARGNRSMPAYVAIVCVKNPICDPLYVLPVRFVVDELKSELDSYFLRREGSGDLSASQEVEFSQSVDSIFTRAGVINFEKFDKFNYRFMKRELPKIGPIILSRRLQVASSKSRPEGPNRKLKTWQDWQMAWDANKVSVNPPAGQDDTEHAALFSAVMHALANAALKPNNVRQVILKPGDILVVDNRRALVARKEYNYPRMLFSSPLYSFSNKQRWLRLYYGFK